jgi:hypothetical protein
MWPKCEGYDQTALILLAREFRKDVPWSGKFASLLISPALGFVFLATRF